MFCYAGLAKGWRDDMIVEEAQRRSWARAYLGNRGTDNKRVGKRTLEDTSMSNDSWNLT